MNLNITGQNWQERLDQTQKFFNQTDIFRARGFLLNNKIDYIYLVNQQKLNLTENQLQLDQIFNNDFVHIYKVRK